MWDRRRRALLLWSPIAWVIATTFWLKRLKRARAVRAFEARERFLLQSEDVGLNPEVQGEENEAFDVNGPQNYKLHDSEVMQPLLISIVSLSRTIAAWFLVLNLISNEIASLYCNGHTVLSWMLTNTAEFFGNRNNNNLARVLLRISLTWNSWWAVGPSTLKGIGKTGSLGAASREAANALAVIDPVATNLQQLALLAAKMNQHNRFRYYTRLLSERNFSIKKELTAATWNRLKGKAKSVVKPVKEIVKSVLE